MVQTTKAIRIYSPGVVAKRPSTRLPGLSKTRRLRSATRALPIDGAAVEQAIRGISGTLPPLGDVGHHVLTALYTVADVDAVADAVQTAATNASDIVQAAADPATVDAATQNSGPFTFIADGLETILKVIDSSLEAVHVPYSYGFSIILLTVLVKIATFPLSKKQVESSIAMQNLQPQVKDIQERNKNNPQQAQQQVAQLYQTAGVNPLAGCLPTLATIPVFIGLYRALLNAANEGVLQDGFFLIPSLAGPTTISAREAGAGTSWLFPLKDGAPPVGWHDALAYLILPVLLVASQFVSQSILQTTRNTDPSQAGAQSFLKVLPLLLGWFSLNVPSGLTLYWITNNVITTGQQLYLKRSAPTPTSQQASAPTTEAPTVKRVIDTVAVDLKPSGMETGARRSNKPREVVSEAPATTQGGTSRKGEKFKARKAREAAKKARSQRRIRPDNKKPRKPFIEEKPIKEVATAFEQELTASPALPVTEKETGGIESQGSTNNRA